MKLHRVIFSSIAMLITTASLTFAETDISGFAEWIHALRVEENVALDGGKSFLDRNYLRADLRAQLRLAGGGEREEYFLRLDILSDYRRTYNNNTEISIREGYVKLYLSNWLNAKVGRQTATWGTGDLLFVNDLFAKDWVAFFTGQELSYLKKPQDLVRLSAFSGSTTIEFAFSPYYTEDNLPSGRRISNNNYPRLQIRRTRKLRNNEMFARMSGYFGSNEWALYAYRGFYPYPNAWYDAGAGVSLFAATPALWSLGTSLRGTLGSFLVNAEGAYYHSRQDSEGNDPLIPNSSLRWLVGIEKNLGTQWTVSSQWFAEKLAKKTGIASQDELKNTATLRIRRTMLQETMRLNLFGFYGITDEDHYLRANIEYDYSDDLLVVLGVNWIDGDKPNTQFGQFKGNSNVYARMRRSF